MSSNANPTPAELPPQLEAALGQIRAALQAGADPATKHAAAAACRVLLVVLEAQPGQPIQVPNMGATAAPASPSAAPAAASSSPTSPSAPTQAPIDLFLARFVDKFGADVQPDPSVPYVRLGQVGAVFEQIARVGIGGVR
ncbi:MAG: hypothetical protein HS109_20185 [Burkholderiales bacterium]|nr:hypothetical protein [Burkholderiales bacterium]